jgi:ubiquinone/menaquinone biosynthesis C-methylase UbiE
MSAMVPLFDLNAERFERYRAFPGDVAQMIRKAVWETTGAQPSAQVLDLGAGSGRIGRAFVEAGDSYLGVDFSLLMLREFRSRNSAACLLQADGAQLPFPDGSFELVLLMQVLSGAPNWRGLLCEASRVIRPGGFIVVGNTVTPPAGVDAQMKKQLALILEEMGVAPHQSNKARQQSLEWLEAGSSRKVQVTAASWTTVRTPREFLDRHRSGAQFSRLPAAVRKEALKRLSAWAATTHGSLHKAFSERHSFELHVFRIEQAVKPEPGGLSSNGDAGSRRRARTKQAEETPKVN